MNTFIEMLISMTFILYYEVKPKWAKVTVNLFASHIQCHDAVLKKVKV